MQMASEPPTILVRFGDQDGPHPVILSSLHRSSPAGYISNIPGTEPAILERC